MYWEALGLRGSAPSPRIEDLARWVQWAESGITSGATENEPEIRWNLSEFWRVKAEIYPSMSDAERQSAHMLDIRAHGLLFALDDGLIFSRSPSYWEYWKAYWAATFSGGPIDVPRPDVSYLANEATQAALDASAGASIAGDQHMANVFSNLADSVPAAVDSANSMWQAKGADVLPGGISLWLWLGAGAAVLYLLGRSR